MFYRLVCIATVLVAGGAAAQQDPPNDELRADIARLGSEIAGLQAAARIAGGRPGEAHLLWILAERHAQRAELRFQLYDLEHPSSDDMPDGLIQGVVIPPETQADWSAFEDLCQRLITVFAASSPGVEAALALGQFRERHGPFRDEGACLRASPGAGVRSTPGAAGAVLPGPLAGGGLEVAARIQLLQDLAHGYICGRSLPFALATFRILLDEHGDCELARLWRERGPSWPTRRSSGWASLLQRSLASCPSARRR